MINQIKDFLKNNIDFLQLETDFNDIIFEFDKDYQDYHYEINTNVFQLNFPGNHDWYWFISIPNNELKNFQDNIDKYPVYFIDFEIPEIKSEANNIKEFLSQWFSKEKLNFLSDKYIKQHIPIICKER